MRYFRASLIIAVLSTVIAAGFFALGLTVMPDRILLDYYAKHLLSFSGGSAFLLPAIAQYAGIFLVAWIIAWTTVDIARTGRKTLVAVVFTWLLFTGSLVFALYGGFYSPFPYFVAALLSFCIGLGYGRSDGGVRKKVLESLFGGRLSAKEFQRLVDSDIPISFSGTMQEASILVCEIRNHEELMVSLSVEDYVAMTNLYLRTASDYLVEIGGYLDECDGESLRVIFGAPLPDERHAFLACKAAVDLMHRLDNLNKECDIKWHKRFDFGIAINSGYLIAAAYGGIRLGGFSVAGDTVEFAHRLCTATAHFGARILIASDTYNLASSTFEARPMELIRRQSDGRRIEIYEILSTKNGLSPEVASSRDHFWKGVIYFREKNWDKAIEEFSKARIQGLPDRALDYYVQRVERWRGGKADANKEENILLNPVS